MENQVPSSSATETGAMFEVYDPDASRGDASTGSKKQQEQAKTKTARVLPGDVLWSVSVTVAGATGADVGTGTTTSSVSGAGAGGAGAGGGGSSSGLLTIGDVTWSTRRFFAGPRAVADQVLRDALAEQQQHQHAGDGGGDGGGGGSGSAACMVVVLRRGCAAKFGAQKTLAKHMEVLLK